MAIQSLPRRSSIQVNGIQFPTLCLPFLGKILPDDKTIESCGVKEKDFFVLMVAKARLTLHATQVSHLYPRLSQLRLRNLKHLLRLLQQRLPLHHHLLLLPPHRRLSNPQVRLHLQQHQGRLQLLLNLLHLL